MERKLIELAWEITDHCNYNCIHCYNPKNRGGLGRVSIKKILKEAKELGVEKIKYGGGEPLSRFDFVEVLRETLNLGFDTTFSTNGSLVDADFAERVKKTGLRRVQVSLDGNESVHNYIRNDARAFSKAVNAINLFVNARLKVSVATTLIKQNLGCLEELFWICSDLGANRWRVMKYVPVSGNDLMPSVEEYKHAQDILKSLKEKSKGLDLFIAKEFNEICGEDRHNFICFGGRSVASIRANGDISPCSYFPEFVIGNLKENSLKELWNSKKMIEFAEEDYGNPMCEYFSNCRGGCKAAAFYLTGQKGCDPYCWVKS